jgi:hypothetical protein
MECRNIREKLGAYAEGVLSDTEEELVRAHLSSCPDCRTVLDDLRRTTELLDHLDRVEPPPWLSMRIMGQIREEAEDRRRIISWFFRPFRVKVPLQAFALVLIVGLAVLVYRENVSQYEPTRIASPSKKSAIADGAPLPKARKSVESEVQPQTPPTKSPPKDRKVVRAEPTTIQRIPEQHMPAAESPQVEEKQAIDALSPRTEMAKGTAHPAPPAGMKDQAETGAIRRDEESSKADAFRAAPSAMGQKSERQRLFDVIVRTHDAEGTSAQIESFLKAIEARNIVTEIRGGAVTIFAEVRNDKGPQLTEMLKQHNTTHLPAIPTEGPSPYFPVKIQIVAP